MNNRGLILTLVPYWLPKGDTIGMFIKTVACAALFYEAPVHSSVASGDYLRCDLFLSHLWQRDHIIHPGLPFIKTVSLFIPRPS